MLKKIDIQKTPLTLEELLAQLSPDDEIMLLRDDIPIGHLTPPTISITDRRVVGLHEGEGWIADDFTDELPDSFWLGDEA